MKDLDTKLKEEKQCDCCGWDDYGYVHEPYCTLLTDNKRSMKNKSIEEFKFWLYELDERELLESREKIVDALTTYHNQLLEDMAVRVEDSKLYEIAERQCPVCGYYCNGKGGNGCIDKRSQNIQEIVYNQALTDTAEDLRNQKI